MSKIDFMVVLSRKSSTAEGTFRAGAFMTNLLFPWDENEEVSARAAVGCASRARKNPGAGGPGRGRRAALAAQRSRFSSEAV
jgi:hypothetical protein